MTAMLAGNGRWSYTKRTQSDTLASSGSLIRDEIPRDKSLNWDGPNGLNAEPEIEFNTEDRPQSRMFCK